MVSNGKSKSANKKDIAEQHIMPKLESSDVSLSLHMAHASNVCNDMVHLTSYLQVKSQKIQKLQRNSCKLLLEMLVTVVKIQGLNQLKTFR